MFSCLDNNILSKNVSDETFEIKLKNLRSCLDEIKVDWREAHCDLKISRNNMLEDTLKNVIKLDPYKVNYFFIFLNKFLFIF